MQQGRIDQLIKRIDAVHASICSVQRDLFRLILQAERCEVWVDWGARDLAHWLSLRYDVSEWKARRWIAAAHALERLPLIGAAFATGELGIDKVVELTRFATPRDEVRLIEWAKRVAGFFIRRKAELLARQTLEEVRDATQQRGVAWFYYDNGKRFSLQADLPAAEGAVVAKAIDRQAEATPVMPGEEESFYREARRADGLVALASARIAADLDPDRATVVVHAPIDALLSEDRGLDVEGSGTIHAETARRLACTARLQVVLENEAGDPVGVGRMSREPSAWMMRQLRYRDFGCTFPGCGTRAFTQAHHVVWWDKGGRTDLDNLVLVCTFHHKLVHEFGWKIKRSVNGTAEWFHPDGTRHRAGPAPPAEAEQQSALSAIGP